MAEPKIAENKPVVMELEPGDYYYCSCGQSAKQPFCDGSHKGSEFAPLKFSVEKSGTYALCACKRTKNPPYCDGTHKQL